MMRFTPLLIALFIAACAEPASGEDAPEIAQTGGLCPEGRAAIEAEDADAAADAYEACLNARRYDWRDEVQLRAQLGSARLVAGDDEAALMSFNQAIGVMADNGGDPDSPVLRRNRAAALMSLGRYEEALEDIDVALARAGRPDAFTQLLRGSALLETGKPAEAVEAFDAAIRIEPDYIGAWSGRSAAFIDLGMTARAVEDGREAVSIAPEDASALNTLCWALVNDERASEGLAICDQAVEADPDSGPIVHSRAAALEQVGRIDEARRLYARAYELAPEDEEIAEDYARSRDF